jgi:uncharacterized membrane protein YqhA
VTTDSTPPPDPDRDSGAHLRVDSAHRAASQSALASRFIALFAIFGTAISALAVFIYGAVFVVVAMWDTMTAGKPTEDGLKHLTLQLVEATDAFLLGTVLYIVSIGFFQLFIDSDIAVPGWMRITNLDQLKTKLVGVIVVLLAVTFLGKASDWRSGEEILYLGGAIALVIGSLAFFGFRAHEKH